MLHVISCEIPVHVKHLSAPHRTYAQLHVPQANMCPRLALLPSCSDAPAQQSQHDAKVVVSMTYRVYQQKTYEPLSVGHIARCLVGTGMQALNCWLAAKVLIRAFKSWSPGVKYLANRFPALQVIS